MYKGDPFLRIRFLVPRTGSRRSGVQELTKNLQFGAKTIMQNLLVPFIFQGECRMKIEHVIFPSAFFKATDPFDGRSFLCVQAIRFSEQTKIGSLKTDLSCE